ncbi:YheC/YheD family protein [Paenibacillus sp. TAB 01]|uniref:YheC/YheD family endospore coat-associated protein n=1 Tax=Paenibacillus sp. TAB 01 TaxID=3368988 RepID=UPI0037526BC4
MMTPSSQYVLGIMTTQTEGDPPFLNRGFYRRLCIAGSRIGLQVFVFTIEGIDWLQHTIQGFAYDASGRQWMLRQFRIPDIVYDRCFFTTRRQYAAYRIAVRKLQEYRPALFLGCGLRGKWEVQHMLEQDSRLQAYLPPTEVMRSVRSVADWLKTRGEVLLKPQSGSQGRGVLHVRRAPRTAGEGARERMESAGPAFSVRGRDARNRRVECGFADAPSLLRWLRRFTAQRNYLLQQYLQLQGPHGDAYDVRALVQKDGTGQWQVTGMAVRRGQNGSLTSNLHGGGSVEPAEAFLAGLYGPARASQLVSELQQLSKLIPEILETFHGRLAELGIDFGVDTHGRIWILEANSKPGRSIFTYLHDDQARYAALVNPIRYARHLLRRSPFKEGIR